MFYFLLCLVLAREGKAVPTRNQLLRSVDRWLNPSPNDLIMSAFGYGYPYSSNSFKILVPILHDFYLVNNLTEFCPFVRRSRQAWDS